MRAAVYEGPGNVRVEDVPDPVLVLDTDAIVAVTDAAIGGSDLWAYRGYGQRPPGARIGHEFLGVVTRSARTYERFGPVTAYSPPSRGRAASATTAEPD